MLSGGYIMVIQSECRWGGVQNTVNSPWVVHTHTMVHLGVLCNRLWVPLFPSFWLLATLLRDCNHIILPCTKVKLDTAVGYWTLWYRYQYFFTNKASLCGGELCIMIYEMKHHQLANFDVF